MTDLEITNLCAEAMGWKHLGAIGYVPKDGETYSDIQKNAGENPWCKSGANDWWRDPKGWLTCGPCSMQFDPLNDDAQAMALVKKFPMVIEPPTLSTREEYWHVESVEIINEICPDIYDKDLNRAICECVAEIQKASLPKATR